MMRRRAALTVGCCVATVLTAVGAQSHALAAQLSASHVAMSRGQAVELSTQQRILDDIRFRQEFGFRSDLSFVASLYSAAGAARPTGFNPLSWGALLTPDERNDMIKRQRMAEAVETTTASTGSAQSSFRGYLQAHQSELAGIWIDQHADGRVNVAFTGHVSEHAAALSHLVPDSELLRVVGVRYSEVDLLSLRDQVTARAGELADRGVTVSSVGPNYRDNDVEVRVPTPSPLEEVTLSSFFPGQPLRLVTSSVGSPTGGHVQDAPPARGGQWIQSCGATDLCLTIYYCTTAFVIEDGTGAFYVGTAGHCGDVGTAWLQDNYFLGQVTASQFGGSARNDAAVIAIRSTDASKQIFIQQVSCGFLCTENDYRIVGSEEQSPVQGEVTCLAGSTSDGEHCASDSAVNQCVNEKDDNGNLHYVCGQVFVSGYTSLPGDSGGSWYQPQTSGTSMAQGINNCAFANNGGSCYEFITYALAHLPGGGNSYFVYH